MASLGCALPIFLAVVGLGIGRGPLVAFGAVALYALSMGAILMLLCLTVALGQQSLLTRARYLGALVEPLGGVLLLIAAGYLLYINVGYLAFDYRLSATLAWSGGILALLSGLGWRVTGERLRPLFRARSSRLTRRSRN